MIETRNSFAIRQKFPGRKDDGGEEFEEPEDGSGDKNMSNQQPVHTTESYSSKCLYDCDPTR